MNNKNVHISTEHQIQENQVVYLGISGGLDSMVLAHLLQAAKLQLHLLHVNYNLRGEDSVLDEKFVRKWAKENAIPLSVLTYDMRAHLAEKGGNLQNEARKVRYSFFQNYLSKTTNSILMTAHHFDDQMETFFLHLSRKSGLVGLSCMAKKNKNHWRPLLDFSKTDLLEYARQNNVKWREDTSNKNNKFLRNIWRNEWLPLLIEKQPSLTQSVQILIKTFQNERIYLEEKSKLTLEMIRTTAKWSFDLFDSATEEEKYIIAKEMGLRYSEMARLNELRTSGKSSFFTVERMEFVVWNQGDHFYFKKQEEIKLPTLHQTFLSTLPIEFQKDVFFADPLKVKGNLVLRHWKEGDRIAPAGMTGSQLISDIIKDAKVQPSAKKEILVVADDEKIIWCVGLKISRLAMAEKTNPVVMKLTVSVPTTI